MCELIFFTQLDQLDTLTVGDTLLPAGQIQQGGALGKDLGQFSDVQTTLPYPRQRVGARDMTPDSPKYPGKTP